MLDINYNWEALKIAKTKPKDCSDVRWRIEQRRRAQVKRSSHAGLEDGDCNDTRSFNTSRYVVFSQPYMGVN